MSAAEDVLGGLVIVALLAAIVVGVWWGHKHPCIRSHRGTCGSMTCVTYDYGTGMCQVWAPDGYPCNICDENAP